MVDYLDLISQHDQVVQIVDIIRSMLRNKPEFWDYIGSEAYPLQAITWHAEWRMISYFNEGSAIDQSSEKSMTRIPTVLVSECRDYAIAVEIGSSRFSSFRLHFLEDPKGLNSFCIDYDLKPEARVKLVSITIDGDSLINVKDFINLSIREDILPELGMWDLSDNDLDLLLLQLPSVLNQYPCNPLPNLTNKSDVMEFLSDSVHWLDLEHRLNYLCQQLSSVIIEGVFWFFKEHNDDNQVSISPISNYDIRFSFPEEKEISYNLLRRSLVPC